MLYQLSYASTGKPSKNIIEAIKLQATFYGRQNHCQIATYKAPRMPGVPYYYTAKAASR